MADAKIETRTTTRLEPVETTESRVELSLTMHEAAAVLRVLHRIAGCHDTTARGLTDQVSQALTAAGVQRLETSISGSILFNKDDTVQRILEDTKENDRPVQVGDMIQVENPVASGGHYGRGDIARVVNTNPTGVEAVFLTPPHSRNVPLYSREFRRIS